MLDKIILDKTDEIELLKSSQKHSIDDLLSMEFNKRDFYGSLKNKINLIEKIGGVLLLLTGILIITNQLQILGFYILNYLPFLANIG